MLVVGYSILSRFLRLFVSFFLLATFLFLASKRPSITICNRLPTLCQDTRSSARWLQDSVNATLYIGCRSLLVADHHSHYVLSPPPSSCIYRGSRATFTIKSFMQFLTLQSLYYNYPKLLYNLSSISLLPLTSLILILSLF